MEILNSSEHEDGSCTFNLNMSAEEENILLIEGLKSLIKEIDKFEPTQSYVLESLDENGDFNVLTLSPEQINILITEGVYQSLKRNINNFKR